MHKQTILVTGAPGNVSTEIVRMLSAANQDVRAAVAVDSGRARLRLGEDLPCVRFDFSDPTTYPAAFAGVRKLYLMRPPAITDVERNRFVPHFKIEQHIQASGLPYTFLRPTYFMQNLSTTYRMSIRNGEIPLPTGRGKMSFIDARDIAAVAAKVLSEDGHVNRAYTLTGSEAYDYFQVAGIFSEVLGKPIRFTRPSFMAYRGAMAAQGMPRALINVTTVMYLIARLGLSATLTADTRTLLGRPPITLREFVRDHADSWR